MSFNSIFIRRASSSIIRSVRSPGIRSISLLNAESCCGVRGQFLWVVRFSTDIIDRKIADPLKSKPYPKEETLAESCINYERKYPYDTKFEAKYKKETICVDIYDPFYYKGEDPNAAVSRMEVSISEGNQELRFDMYVRPDQFKIFGVELSNEVDDHLENYEEYVESKGVNSETINMLFDHFGLKPKNNTDS